MSVVHRILFAGVTAGLVGLCLGQSVDPGLYSGLVWRNIGPFRGGRVAAVTGAVGQPGVFYMGLPAGGVWKSTSAGETWKPIFDSIQDASSVGAIEVAPSDSNVIYVGMGDMRTGGSINEGNGVYKSTDAGQTWVHLGLDDTKQIPSILVDPHNPDIVMVAAQGSYREESEARGLFRSTDGGKTWKQTLFVNKRTGVQKITWAYDHPETMLLTTDNHYTGMGAPARGAGFGGGAGAAGANQVTDSGTHLYVSHDEGVTWNLLKAKGLPALAGRTCVAIANGTNAQRMFLVGNFGLYRSDDGGANWRQMDATDRRVANGQGGYNCGVYVNPKNPEIVYVINTCCYRSLDGGNTFTGFKGAPGGDDPQQMWLDPTDGNRLFLGTDQGATVSLDGGQNWSSWYNQPTAQVYHISCDTQFPYWVYATQQDSGCIATASRGNLGAITPMDWLPHPGYEFGSVVADPLNSKISYAGASSGGIIKTTYPSGQWVDVGPTVNSSLGLRKVGNQPLLFNPVNPHELIAPFQFVMSTTDGGVHWTKISPDLGLAKGAVAPKPATAPSAKPTTTAPATKPTGPTKIGGNQEMDDDDGDKDHGQDADEEQFQPGGGSIESMSISSIDGKTMWVGTSNGMIKVTRNHGSEWEDVTIPNLPNAQRADMSSIDASHHAVGTAYVAIDYHNAGDLKPYVYRTRDFGKTWTKIVGGLPDNQPSGSFARVIRADTVKKGLLYLGTESSLYVSFDDGDHWQSLRQNAPTTSYRDMVVKGNDLVVGTYGRGFWVLDDLSPLRQISETKNSEPAHLFKPGNAVRVRRNVNGDTPFPPEVPHALNPPVGALIYYSLASESSGGVRIEISDSSGQVIRRMSSSEVGAPYSPPPVPDFWIEAPHPLPTSAGMHRISWNLRYDNPQSFGHNYDINANPGETPASPEGPLALPGDYKVTLIVDGKSTSQTVTVVNDPRSPASAADLKAEHELQMELYNTARSAYLGYLSVQGMRKPVGKIMNEASTDELGNAAEAFDSKLSGIMGTAGGGRRGGGGFGGGGARPAPSFAGVMGSMINLMTTLDSGDMAPTEQMVLAAKNMKRDFETVRANWAKVNANDVAVFNKVLAKHKLPEIRAAVAL